MHRRQQSFNKTKVQNSIMTLKKIPPLGLSLFLHFAPICKAVQTTHLIATPSAAIVLRWVAVIAAMVGSHHTVSGASAAIVGLTKYTNNTPILPTTNNAVATAGQIFRFRITVSNAGSDHNTDYFNCIPLPSGLTINTNLGGNGFITNAPGTTTATGVYPVRLYAGNTSYPTPVTYDATITITAGVSPPTITNQPVSATVLLGSDATFAAGASGSPLPVYQWLKDSVPITNATSATLTINNSQPSDAGGYSVRVSNSAGTNVSQTATLTVVNRPTLSLAGLQAGQINLGFTSEPTVGYTVEFSATMEPGSWSILTNYPAQGLAASRTFTDSTTGTPMRAYRLRMILP